jgi:D-alanyl-lipoteichoic acid acyltransferase DltB (MBOAT superfamily)
MSYWLLPHKFRIGLIFVSSCVFYGFWRPEFLLLIFISASIDYLAALKMIDAQNTTIRKRWLWLSLSVNLGLLCYFKYLFFIVDNATLALNYFGYNFQAPALNIILPLAISFYTFETISYIVDVYHKQIEPEKNFWRYSCFVIFFPKLIAGPVLRASEILPQFKQVLNFRNSLFISGLHRIIVGLFLKVVVADNLAPIVDAGFSQPINTLSALDVWTLAFLFGFQIYFDFSAYSSIAIGSARLFGIHIPENFYFPYASSSPKEFWQRWHISLSSWIRDYLYLPLQGEKVKAHSSGGISITSHHYKRSAFIFLFITWAIMGLWHGASWTFLIWGLYHASIITLYRLINTQAITYSGKIKKYLGWSITLPLMMLGWIPFRAQSVQDTLMLWSKIFSPNDYLWLGMRENTYIIAALSLMAFLLAYAFHSIEKDFLVKRSAWAFMIVTTGYTLGIYLIIIFLRPINQFIYFQF